MGCSCQARKRANGCVKAKTEQHLRIMTHVPNASDLKKLGVTSSKNVVLELTISIYSLEQAGRFWTQLLYHRLVESGFTLFISDLCFSYKQDSGGVVIVEV